MDLKINLKNELNSIEYIEDNCYSMFDLPRVLFNNNVKILQNFNEDDSYEGNACYIYEYENYYFTITIEFGSCDFCDSWIGNSKDDHESTIDYIFNEIELITDLWKIQIGYNYLYLNPMWRTQLKKLMKKHNILKNFLDYHKQDEEKLEFSNKYQIEMQEKEIRLKQQEQLKYNEMKSNLHDLIMFFKFSEFDDEFYNEKKLAKQRQLQSLYNNSNNEIKNEIFNTLEMLDLKNLVVH
jgi:hypothetical protein